MITCMRLVEKVSMTIRPKAGFFTTTMLIRTLGTLMVRSSLAGTRLLGTMAGQPFKEIVDQYFALYAPPGSRSGRLPYDIHRSSRDMP